MIRLPFKQHQPSDLIKECIIYLMTLSYSYSYNWVALQNRKVKEPVKVLLDAILVRRFRHIPPGRKEPDEDPGQTVWTFYRKHLPNLTCNVNSFKLSVTLEATLNVGTETMGGVGGVKLSGLFPFVFFSLSPSPGTKNGDFMRSLMELEPRSSIKMSLEDKALSGCWLPGIYPLGWPGLLIWQARTQRQVLITILHEVQNKAMQHSKVNISELATSCLKTLTKTVE